jgi:hypothetical protein
MIGVSRSEEEPIDWMHSAVIPVIVGESYPDPPVGVCHTYLCILRLFLYLSVINLLQIFAI